MTNRAELLEHLSQLLWLFGTANDADDHNCGPEGDQLRKRAADGIREVIRDHAFVLDLLPTLEEELENGLIEGVGWDRFVDALEPEIRAARNGPKVE